MCAKSKWKYSNLELQKIVYMAHMFYLGEQDTPLVFGHFEAWKYGPVHPELYYTLKGWGSAPIPKNAAEFAFIGKVGQRAERKTLNETVESFPPGDGPQLIAITHREGSAWKKLYRENVRGIVIPNNEILAEYEILDEEASAAS